jgi:putative heme-binding domain-containing protein
MKQILPVLLLFSLGAGQEDAALKLVLDVTRPLAEREAAVKGLSRTRTGAALLFGLADQGKLPQELRATAVFALADSPDAEVRKNAEVRLPRPKSKDGTPLPPIADLLARKGDPKIGAKVYRRPEGPNCIGCHPIGDEGRQVGPPLNTIGTKLGREQLNEAILTPSAAVLMSYENWAVQTKDGDVKTGIKVEDTDDHVTLKDTNGEYVDIPLGNIAAKKMLSMSMMPDDLTKTMTLQELVDVIEYLSTLRAE